MPRRGGVALVGSGSASGWRPYQANPGIGLRRDFIQHRSWDTFRLAGYTPRMYCALRATRYLSGDYTHFV